MNAQYQIVVIQNYAIVPFAFARTLDAAEREFDRLTNDLLAAGADVVAIRDTANNSFVRAIHQE